MICIDVETFGFFANRLKSTSNLFALRLALYKAFTKSLFILSLCPGLRELDCFFHIYQSGCFLMSQTPFSLGRGFSRS